MKWRKKGDIGFLFFFLFKIGVAWVRGSESFGGTEL
jgi:hypothetical protein